MSAAKAIAEGATTLEDDMKELTAFQAQAASIALNKILSGKHFSICDFDKLAKSIGAQVGGPDYDALNNLHCVDWAAMPAEVRAAAREKVVELLGLPPEVIDMPKAETRQENNEAPRIKLAFWKR